MLPIITILRHAEKQIGDGPPLSVPDGTRVPESLSVVGWQRAGALVGLFSDRCQQTGVFRLATPSHLFASRIGESTSLSRRPRETLEPLSECLGVDIDGRFLKDQVDELVAAVRACSGAVLIAWEHRMIPRIAATLLGGTAKAPAVWPDDRFDVLWVFEPDVTRSRFRLRQVPQLLLAGDLDRGI